MSKNSTNKCKHEWIQIIKRNGKPSIYKFDGIWYHEFYCKFCVQCIAKQLIGAFV